LKGPKKSRESVIVRSKATWQSQESEQSVRDSHASLRMTKIYKRKAIEDIL